MTAADEALIAFAGSRGHAVTSRQLKRWRSEGLLPERRRRGLGRGRGVDARDPPWSCAQVIAVIEALQHRRSTEHAALELWFEGWDIKTSTVRALVDRQIEAERKHFTELQAQAGPAGDLFDVAELDSQITPVRRDELNRMRALASAEDTPHQLVHAIRSALSAQVLGGREQDVAIEQEQLAAYLALDEFVPLFDLLGGEVPIDDLIDTLPTMNPLTELTDQQLKDSRWRLRRMHEAPEVLSQVSDPTAPQALPGMLADMLGNQLSGYAPGDDDYTPEQLINALRVVAAARPEPVEFRE